MSDQIEVGLVGYGKSARIFHAPFLKASEKLNLRSVVQRHSESSKEDFPDVMVVQDLKSMLKDDRLDLVIVTTPNSLHYEHAREALLAEKHVVVEKPLTPISKEAYKLIELAEKQEKILTVYHNRRWDGDFLTVKKLLKDNAVGRPVEFISTFNRFRNSLREDAWKEKDLPGSGILYDLGSHLMDQALQLFGSPDSFHADIRSQRGGAADDYFEIDFYYDEDNFKVKLKAGMLVADDTPRFVLRGTKGSYVKYGLDPQENALKAGEDPLQPGWGREEETKWGILRTFDGEAMKDTRIETLPGSYLSFYDDLAEAISENRAPAVNAREAAEAIEWIEKAAE